MDKATTLPQQSGTGRSEPFAAWFLHQRMIMAGQPDDDDVHNESLNRYRTIKHRKKEKFGDYGWSTKMADSVYNFYPIYDWKVDDIWTSVFSLLLPLQRPRAPVRFWI